MAAASCTIRCKQILSKLILVKYLRYLALGTMWYIMYHKVPRYLTHSAFCPLLTHLSAILNPSGREIVIIDIAKPTTVYTVHHMS